MTLKDWMMKHFFDSINPYKIVTENGEELEIEWEEFIDYTFIKCETVDGEDIITVK